jgi:hypothetical protein
MKKPEAKKKVISVLDDLPEYIRHQIGQRRQAVATQRVAAALGQAAVNLSPEECENWARQLRDVNRAALLPEDCHLSRQSRALFNLLVRHKCRAPFLTIARSLWRDEYDEKGWADLNPQSPEYRTLLDRIRKVQKDLKKQLLDGKGGYETHFSSRQEVVTLEKL